MVYQRSSPNVPLTCTRVVAFFLAPESLIQRDPQKSQGQVKITTIVFLIFLLTFYIILQKFQPILFKNIKEFSHVGKGKREFCGYADKEGIKNQLDNSPIYKYINKFKSDCHLSALQKFSGKLGTDTKFPNFILMWNLINQAVSSKLLFFK